ncbi:peptide chain release factor 1 [Mollicutes bacterium LVI A0039]|nr:peptide chain release factor 1 [Mollicutes bacterium LVI A0039]
MFEKLIDLEVKYLKLQEDLANPEVLKDVSNIAKISKEIKDLEPIIAKFKEYKANMQDIEESKELLEIEDDADMLGELKEIISNCEANIVEIEADLKVLMLPKDPNDGKNAILEIRGAAGGDEANIFAYDLYRMYTKYAETQGWKTELLESQDSPGGGFSNVSVLLKGNDVFSKMKFESGAHRVQRVPVTESQGRVHTSTATVVVMPEIEDVDVDIKDADLKIDTYRSSGAGGQSVNTTDSAVRITHLPTGIVVTSQDERSQISNREKAMKVIRAKIYDHYLQIQLEENDSMRKNKLGTGSRSEKIRTYNYPQNRVTDHRIGLTLNKLDVIIDGKLDEVIEALVLEDQMERMQSVE